MRTQSGVYFGTFFCMKGARPRNTRSTVSGRIFGRGRTALVATAGITGLLGFASVRFFDNMLANATVARITDNGIDNAVMSVQPFTFILGAFVIALICTVFSIGDRLQRDTDGLV